MTAPFDFPPSPSNGQTYTANGISFTWNGSVWKRVGSGNIGGVPSGGIIIWSGASNLIGSSSSGGTGPGWYLCDGSNGTPDLRERFIVGAGGDNSAVSGTSGYSVNATGGENSVTLTTNQLPSHTHNLHIGTNQDDDGDNRLSRGTHQNDITSSSTEYIFPTGGGQSHENRPPYFALCYIMKS